jgi:hypothetical protein
MAIDEDEELRQRVGVRDFQAFEGLELTEEEELMLSDATVQLPDAHPRKVLVAAESEPEVAGFMSHDWAGTHAGYWPPDTARAIEYARDTLRDPSLQASFTSWQRNHWDLTP